MSSIKEITLKGTLGALIPKTQADLLHYALAYIIYRTTLDITDHAGIALLVTTIFVTGKELNDQFGWIKKLLSDGKTLTKFSGPDWWKGMLIPLILTIINYLS